MKNSSTDKISEAYCKLLEAARNYAREEVKAFLADRPRGYFIDKKGEELRIAACAYAAAIAPKKMRRKR